MTKITINKRRGSKCKPLRRKTSKRKVYRRKLSGRKVYRRNTSKRKLSGRKASKRKTSKRKTSGRKLSGRKISTHNIRRNRKRTTKKNKKTSKKNVKMIHNLLRIMLGGGSGRQVGGAPQAIIQAPPVDESVDVGTQGAPRRPVVVEGAPVAISSNSTDALEKFKGSLDMDFFTQALVSNPFYMQDTDKLLTNAKLLIPYDTSNYMESYLKSLKLDKLNDLAQELMGKAAEGVARLRRQERTPAEMTLQNRIKNNETVIQLQAVVKSGQKMNSEARNRHEGVLKDTAYNIRKEITEYVIANTIQPDRIIAMGTQSLKWGYKYAPQGSEGVTLELDLTGNPDYTYEDVGNTTRTGIHITQNLATDVHSILVTEIMKRVTRNEGAGAVIFKVILFLMLGEALQKGEWLMKPTSFSRRGWGDWLPPQNGHGGRGEGLSNRIEGTAYTLEEIGIMAASEGKVMSLKRKQGIIPNYMDGRADKGTQFITRMDLESHGGKTDHTIKVKNMYGNKESTLDFNLDKGARTPEFVPDGLKEITKRLLLNYLNYYAPVRTSPLKDFSVLDKLADFLPNFQILFCILDCILNGSSCEDIVATIRSKYGVTRSSRDQMAHWMPIIRTIFRIVIMTIIMIIDNSLIQMLTGLDVEADKDVLITQIKALLANNEDPIIRTLMYYINLLSKLKTCVMSDEGDTDEIDKIVGVQDRGRLYLNDIFTNMKSAYNGYIESQEYRDPAARTNIKQLINEKVLAIWQGAGGVLVEEPAPAPRGLGIRPPPPPGSRPPPPGPGGSDAEPGGGNFAGVNDGIKALKKVLETGISVLADDKAEVERLRTLLIDNDRKLLELRDRLEKSELHGVPDTQGLEDEINKLIEKKGSLEEQLETAESDLSGAKGDISTEVGNVEKDKDDMDAIESALNTLREEIQNNDNLDEEIKQLLEDLGDDMSETENAGWLRKLTEDGEQFVKDVDLLRKKTIDEFINRHVKMSPTLILSDLALLLKVYKMLMRILHVFLVSITLKNIPHGGSINSISGEEIFNLGKNLNALYDTLLRIKDKYIELLVPNGNFISKTITKEMFCRVLMRFSEEETTDALGKVDLTLIDHIRKNPYRKTVGGTNSLIDELHKYTFLDTDSHANDVLTLGKWCKTDLFLELNTIAVEVRVAQDAEGQDNRKKYLQEYKSDTDLYVKDSTYYVILCNAVLQTITYMGKHWCKPAQDWYLSLDDLLDEDKSRWPASKGNINEIAKESNAHALKEYNSFPIDGYNGYLEKIGFDALGNVYSDGRLTMDGQMTDTGAVIDGESPPHERLIFIELGIFILTILSQVSKTYKSDIDAVESQDLFEGETDYMDDLFPTYNDAVQEKQIALNVKVGIIKENLARIAREKGAYDEKATVIEQKQGELLSDDQIREKESHSQQLDDDFEAAKNKHAASIQRETAAKAKYDTVLASGGKQGAVDALKEWHLAYTNLQNITNGYLEKVNENIARVEGDIERGEELQTYYGDKNTENLNTPEIKEVLQGKIDESDHDVREVQGTLVEQQDKLVQLENLKNTLQVSAPPPPPPTDPALTPAESVLLHSLNEDLKGIVKKISDLQQWNTDEAAEVNGWAQKVKTSTGRDDQYIRSKIHEAIAEERDSRPSLSV